MKKNNYLVFCYYHYYPQGGASDFLGSCETLLDTFLKGETAIEAGYGEHYDVIELETNKVYSREEIMEALKEATS